MIRYVARIIYQIGVRPPMITGEAWNQYTHEQALRLLEALLGLEGFMESAVMTIGGWKMRHATTTYTANTAKNDLHMLLHMATKLLMCLY